MRRIILIIALFGLVSRTAVAQVVMETVTVGNPGNMPDDEVMSDGTTGYGGVAYTFNIGKYEVTYSQYAEFLNAIAATDPNRLYDESMGLGLGGITRTGSSGSYTYSPTEGWGNLPVGHVSWYDTLRFVNWLHNGQPTGAQDPSTTEDGAYDMALGSAVLRKPGARVFLPTEDEWYKAAYYKGGGTDAGYWDYPTQSDMAPMNESPPGTDFVNGSATYRNPNLVLTYPGSFTAKPSDSAYHTFDQGGNVSEWTETLIGSSRSVRGGSFVSGGAGIRATARGFWHPESDFVSLGFRVAEFSSVCDKMDSDGDGDIDIEDYAALQRCFTGKTE